MTSTKLEQLQSLITTYGQSVVQHTGYGPANREALVKWVDAYGQAMRREARRDVAGRSPKQKTTARGAP